MPHNKLNVDCFNFCTIKYKLLHKQTIVATIEINGTDVSIDSSPHIKISNDEVYTKWYKSILAPFMTIFEQSQNCKNVFTIIDLLKKKNLGIIKFDKGYKTFSTTVVAPYKWIASEGEPPCDQDRHSGSYHRYVSEVCRSPGSKQCMSGFNLMTSHQGDIHS